MKIWLKVFPEDEEEVQRLGGKLDKKELKWFYSTTVLTDLPVMKWVDLSLPANQKKFTGLAAKITYKPPSRRSVEKMLKRRKQRNIRLARAARKTAAAS